MSVLLVVVVIFVALQHLGFLVLEMVYWTRPIGLKIFRQTESQAQSSKALALNQGLYNGFLAAGLFWGVAHPNLQFSDQILVFFLGCVVVAGVVGALTVSRRILLIQAVPAAVALILLFGQGL